LSRAHRISRLLLATPDAYDACDAAAPFASGDLASVLPEAATAPLEIYLAHRRRIGPSARLLREFLLATTPDNQV
jgi:hypothetical protein